MKISVVENESQVIVSPDSFKDVRSTMTEPQKSFR